MLAFRVSFQNRVINESGRKKKAKIPESHSFTVSKFFVIYRRTCVRLINIYFYVLFHIITIKLLNMNRNKEHFGQVQLTVKGSSNLTLPRIEELILG